MQAGNEEGHNRVACRGSHRLALSLVPQDQHEAGLEQTLVNFLAQTLVRHLSQSHKKTSNDKAAQIIAMRSKW
jgi:hypothetical protein